MDDSDQDFVDLCAKLLKRVHKKPGEPRQPRKAEHQPSSQANDGDKRRNNKRDGDSGSKFDGSQAVCTGAEAEQHAIRGGSGYDSGDAGPTALPAPATPRAKDKVIQRMQQFKRASPQRIVNRDKSQTTNHVNGCVPSPPLVQRRDTAESFSSGLHPEPQDSDEALALRLQEELDRETAEAQTVDLEDGGLFFCQICQRDLTHMTPKGRTQHLNRCLDESEKSGPAPPPPPAAAPGVPDCPICGKKFKSQKSRSAHLKRCSSDMGISPAVLLQALQRQAEENQNVYAANTLTETGGTKRKGLPKAGLPANKKSRKKNEPLDEDTMVALTLSSSLLEQERKSERELEPGAVSMTAALKWRPDAGRGHVKRKKGTHPCPPPLLLVQDSEAALTRLQERVSALLLRTRAPSPPTPTLCPSSLLGWSGAAPLWQKSALLDGGSTCVSDFYTPELREFITPWESATAEAASSSTGNKPESSVQPVSEGTPLTGTRASVPPSSPQATASPAPSTPGTGQLPVGSQTLRDLMELAEDGMTLTQGGYTATGPDKEKGAGVITNVHLSGFVLEESEEQADLCVSGFLPETTHTCSDDTHSQAKRTTDQPGADTQRGPHQSVVLSRLASDLSSMVNNPQLSDVQLQVDSGEVYFAHSFMVYARCPLLAEMVHESGFGVQEEGVPAAQRVLMSGVPGQAVFDLLQYLYTAKCSIPASLQPHVLELASRFDLQELQQLCKFCQEDAATQGEEDDYMNVNNHTDQAFVDLLHSMWNEQDEDEGVDTDRGSDEERGPEGAHQTGDLTADDREIGEEKVNEEELEEIYEFAATQRKMVEEKDIVEEEDEEEEEEEYGEEVFTNLKEPRKSLTGCSIKNLQLDHSLDRSYKRLFSDSWGVYEEGDPSTLPSTSAPAKTHTLQFQQHHPHKPSSELSSRTLLQSSASVVSGISPSPPPTTSNLPVPGQYLSQVGDHGTTVDDPDVPLKRESQGLRSICPPALPPEKKQPELIVLSDSSEEMEVVLSSCSPSPHFPCEGYTQIKPQPALKPSGPTPEIKKSSSLQFSPDDPPAALAHSPVDWSPEVSWLLLSTPLQSGRSNMTTSSTQTRSSMCRTQLFPKGDTSLSLSNRPQSSNSPAGVSAHVGPAEGSILEKVLHSFSSDLNASPKKKSRCEPFAVPSSQSKCSHSSDTPLHLQPQPYSSTPLHTELHQPPALPASSPLHSSLDKQRSVIQGGDRAPPDSPERTDLGSFHLSLLSDPSDPPSSSSHRGLTQRHNDSSRQIRQSVESSNITGGELTSRGRDEESEIECEINDKHDEGEQEEAETGATDVAESSFHQSFMAMDEPPIAFNDSWGLDACVDANPGCFSLRLEDSRGSSRQERSLGQRETAGSSSSTSCHPSPSSPSISLLNGHGSVTPSAPSRAQPSQPSTSAQARTELSFTPSPPDPTTRTTPEINNSLLDSKIWDSWEEEVEEMNPSVQPKTPGSYHNKKCHTLVPITPMPHYSDMDTPELKNKLNRFGVRPLPKRQMILKLKEIHQYTHQLVSSDSEDEAPSAGRAAQMKPLPGSSAAAGNRPLSCAQTVKFKEPQAPAATSPLKHNREEEAEPLSASQGSNTSSTAASEEFERSNPELCPSSDSDSDGGMSASQADLKIQDRLRAVRSFILSDSRLYTQILQYQPLVLSQLQERLKAAGIRLGAAKLVDYLDSQCITFTTAKPGHLAPSRRRGKRTGKGTKTAGESGASRKRAVTAV